MISDWKIGMSLSVQKSGLKSEEIPLDLIKTTYELLLEKGEVTQNYLSKELNAKRSAFIIAAFSLLEVSILYEEVDNKIILTQ